MATPNYLGQSQPVATSGSWLSRLFAGDTPAYIGAAAGPVVPRASYFSITPTYQSAGSGIDATSAATPAQIAIVIPRQVVEPQT
jgi:hypothetical protein